MKAVVITRPGGPEVLEIQQRPLPEPGTSQVRIRVHASALNRADISQRLGRYPAPEGSPPDIPGLEYAGEIDALGPGASMWDRGERVMGITGGGGHAEFLCVHEREVMPVPSRLSFEQAAAIPEVFLTAYDAMFVRLGLTAGERLLIHAAGSGVGTAAIQLAGIAGIRTLGTSRSAAKLEKAANLGLEVGIVSSPDWSAKVLAATGGKGVDAILDLVGGSYLSGNLNALAPRGRMVVVGLTAGAKAELDMGAILRKRLTMVGTVLRARPVEEKISLARTFAATMIPMFDDGRLVPVVDSVHRFDSIRDAHALMESNATFGKIVLSWS